MSGPFAAMIHSLFASGLALPAVYRPMNGDDVTVSVIRTVPTQEIGMFQTSVIQHATLFDIRVSDVARPVRGDVVVLDGVNYEVQSTELDSEKLAWRLNVDEQ